jgi:hypothetical protein
MIKNHVVSSVNRGDVAYRRRYLRFLFGFIDYFVHY